MYNDSINTATGGSTTTRIPQQQPETPNVVRAYGELGRSTVELDQRLSTLEDRLRSVVRQEPEANLENQSGLKEHESEFAATIRSDNATIRRLINRVTYLINHLEI